MGPAVEPASELLALLHELAAELLLLGRLDESAVGHRRLAQSLGYQLGRRWQTVLVLGQLLGTLTVMVLRCRLLVGCC